MCHVSRPKICVACTPASSAWRGTGVSPCHFHSSLGMRTGCWGSLLTLRCWTVLDVGFLQARVGGAWCMPWCIQHGPHPLSVQL